MYNNPFVECTARDMSYGEVLKYWCSPFVYYKLEENLLLNSLTPIFIQGARGSGKTMILKYLCYFCQKELAQNTMEKSVLQHFQETGSIGFYFRYKDDFGKFFKALTCSPEIKEDLFLHYYELYITREILYVLDDIQKNYPFDEMISHNLRVKVSELLCASVSEFQIIIEELNTKISSIDNWVKQCRYISKSEELLRELITCDNLVRKICEAIRTTVPEFKNIKFMIIIDEYENVSDYQRLINTLFKQVDSSESITYRIGMRPGGMYTYKTNVGGEFLQFNRDYIQIDLKFPEINSYKKFIREVANRRLESIEAFRDKQFIDIEEILGKRENPEEEALKVVKSQPEKHFNILKNKFKLDEEFDNAKEALKHPENPLIEMLNIIWVLRGVTLEETSITMKSRTTRSTGGLILAL